ncbi:MAG TPA: hypothetical protein DCM05_01320 [Elusimicrobia bacterium]|nr:hypothetical protein [Elusimicrobiota bacterium]
MKRTASAVLAVLLSAAGAPAPAHALGKFPPKKEAAVNGSAKIAVADVSPNFWKGPHSASNAPAAFTAETAEDWSKLWTQYLNRKAPPVDFSKYFAAAVFIGLRQTGGYAVEFLPPESDGKTAKVPYRIKSPGKGGFVTQAFTTAYAIQLYTRPGLPIQVEEKK